jgi:hypothetical protein
VSHDEDVRQTSMVPSRVADTVALALFVLIGIHSHHETGVRTLFVRNAVPLEIAWFAVASVAGTYRRPGIRTLVWTWAVAVPAGLLVRTLWVGSPAGVRLVTFLAVGLVFTSILLLIGRGLVRLIERAKGSRSDRNVVR